MVSVSRKLTEWRSVTPAPKRDITCAPATTPQRPRHRTLQQLWRRGCSVLCSSWDGPSLGRRGHTSQHSAAASVAAQAGLFADAAVALSKAFYFRGNARTARAGRPKRCVWGCSRPQCCACGHAGHLCEAQPKLAEAVQAVNTHERGGILPLEAKMQGRHRGDQGPWGIQVGSGVAKSCSRHNI